MKNVCTVHVEVFYPVGGGGGGGVEGGRKEVTSNIYGIVRMCVPNGPLFQHCKVYD